MHVGLGHDTLFMEIHIVCLICVTKSKVHFIFFIISQQYFKWVLYSEQEFCYVRVPSK